MDKWGYSYLIELKTLREKEKLLVTSNFSFSNNVFKSCLLLIRQNEYLWSKGLIRKLCLIPQSFLNLKEAKFLGLYLPTIFKNIIGVFLQYFIELRINNFRLDKPNYLANQELCYLQKLLGKEKNLEKE